eukprot:g5465.t1
MRDTKDCTNETNEALALRVNKLICLGQPASVQKLLNAGADPDGRVKGVPHLVAAARAGRVRILKVLLRAGAKIDAQDSKTKATALGTAAFTLRSEAVTALTEAGARLKNTQSDKHAIHTATLAAKVGIVKDLVFAGADLEVGYPADLNRTPLHLAVAYGVTPVAQYLLRAGAKVNVTDALGCTPLYSASYVGHVQCAIELLSFGADMMAVNGDGNSALEACCQEGHVAVVKELIGNGVLRASPPGTSAWVAFVSLVAAARSGHVEVADVLIKAGVPPMQEGHIRYGPLSAAAAAGKLRVARRILEASGKVDERDSHGCTPLIRASESLRPRLVAFLLGSGADHTIRSSCGCDKDAFMSIGQIDLVKNDLEGRSKEDLELDRRLTRRILLQAVAYKAVSLATF